MVDSGNVYTLMLNACHWFLGDLVLDFLAPMHILRISIGAKLSRDARSQVVACTRRSLGRLAECALSMLQCPTELDL